MMSESTRAEDAGLSLKHAALLAGFGLLVMVFAAPVANFYFMAQSVVSGDIAQTVERLRTQGAPYLIGALLLFVTYLMDIVVAWALYWYLRPGQPALAQLVAWSRLVYAALAFVGLWASIKAYDLATNPGVAEQLSEAELQSGVLIQLAASSSMETMALALFGIHLAMLSLAIWRARHVPAWVGVAVLLAGLSYVAIFLGRYFAPDIDLTWLLLLALGELVFMVWLLAIGWRARRVEMAVA